MLNRKKSAIFFSIQILLAFILTVFIFQPLKWESSTRREIAKQLMLTDLCLTTESRHTRHLSSADFLAPFQDFPGGPDHYPSSLFIQFPSEILEPSNVEGKQ